MATHPPTHTHLHLSPHCSYSGAGGALDAKAYKATEILAKVNDIACRSTAARRRDSELLGNAKAWVAKERVCGRDHARRLAHTETLYNLQLR